MAKIILQLVDAFSWLAGPVGVDYAQFRSILAVKLTLDGRRQWAGVAGGTGKKEKDTYVLRLIMYAFVGIMVGQAMLVTSSVLVSMTIVHAFLMVMVAMSLIADYSSILLETTDAAILLPRPVTPRTVLVARLVHVCVYLGTMTLSLALCPMIIGTIKLNALFLPVFVVTLIGSVVIVVTVVSMFYLMAARFTDVERFRDLILYAQIGMTVLFIGGYQVLPRLINMRSLRNVNIEGRLWTYFFPPAWLAGPLDLAAGNWRTPQLILTGLACLIPAVSFGLVVRVLAPGFHRLLARPEQARPAARPIGGGSSVRSAIVRVLGRAVARDRIERAAFELIWQVSSRDRQFKLRTYPGVAFALIFGLAYAFSNVKGGFVEGLASLAQTQKHLLLLYMACVMAPSAMIHLRFSDQYQAAWIFRSLPVARPGQIMSAGLKVVFIRFVLPAFCVVAIVTLGIWGTRIATDVVVAACAVTFVVLLAGRLFARAIPFAEKFGAREGSGQFFKSILMLGLPAGLGGLHYLCVSQRILLLPAIPVLLAAAGLLARSYARTDWDSVR